MCVSFTHLEQFQCFVHTPLPGLEKPQQGEVVMQHCECWQQLEGPRPLKLFAKVDKLLAMFWAQKLWQIPEHGCLLDCHAVGWRLQNSLLGGNELLVSWPDLEPTDQ